MEAGELRGDSEGLGEVKTRVKGRAVKVKGKWGYRSRKIKATDKRDTDHKGLHARGYIFCWRGRGWRRERGLKAKRKGTTGSR